jgi:hypothetical protein
LIGEYGERRNATLNSTAAKIATRPLLMTESRMVAIVVVIEWTL